MNCRHCQSKLKLELINLGTAPPSNAYLTTEMLSGPEKFFPLRVLICESCWLAQTEDYSNADELFSPDYAYFSSYSTTWLNHAKNYVKEMAKRFDLSKNSLVVEVAANDGYLLQYVKESGIRCLGIEPTRSTAAAARTKDIPIVEEFFGASVAQRLATEGQSADLMVANNVLAHVPNINDFVSGFAKLLKPTGVATFEFPHLAKLIQYTQFDTIYHEHYSYLLLHTVVRIFEGQGLGIFDVEELPTHGGSLRVFAQRLDFGQQEVTSAVQNILAQEDSAGLLNPTAYQDFKNKSGDIKFNLISFLINAKNSGKNVCAYGAAAKGNTLLNFAGIRSDLISFVTDKNINKQGHFLPGSRIAIYDEQIIRDEKPDYVLILPWNLRSEIVEQLHYIRDWQGKFVTATPKLEIF